MGFIYYTKDIFYFWPIIYTANQSLSPLPIWQDAEQRRQGQ